MKKPCLKCLLEQIGKEDFSDKITAYIEKIPPEELVDEQTYLNRLEICQNCSNLQGSVCGVCGCFIRFRAAKNDKHCPGEEKLW